MVYQRKTCECCGAPKYDGRHNLLIAISTSYEMTRKWESMENPLSTTFSQKAINKLKEMEKEHSLTPDEMMAIITRRV